MRLWPIKTLALGQTFERNVLPPIFVALGSIPPQDSAAEWKATVVKDALSGYLGISRDRSPWHDTLFVKDFNTSHLMTFITFMSYITCLVNQHMFTPQVLSDFTIVIFIHCNPRIAVAILDL